MPRITPVRWQILECIFKKAGFSFERQKGDHKVYSKTGVHRPVIIPTYKEVRLDIIKSNMRTAKMTNKEYFQLLEECK
ncbi:MAG: type II toxin-antitoxin system HicA family toxin [Thermodesulfobacteriota bacterium]